MELLEATSTSKAWACQVADYTKVLISGDAEYDSVKFHISDLEYLLSTIETIHPQIKDPDGSRVPSKGEDSADGLLG